MTKCPKCGCRELHIEVATTANILFEDDEDESFCVLDVYGDVEWGSGSSTRCNDCDFSGKLKDFEEQP